MPKKNRSVANSVLRDLHVYRGIEPCPPGVTMGHEFSGVVVEKGTSVTTVSVGDRIVSPFTTSWSAAPSFLSSSH